MEQDLDERINTLLTNGYTRMGTNFDAPDAGEALSKLGRAAMVEDDVVTGHQPLWEPEDELSDVEQDSSSEPPFVPTEAEKDVAQRRSAKPVAAAKGIKRPLEREVDDDDVPNLDEIFGNYDTPIAQRISICRAYASYLASMQPKKPVKRRAVKDGKGGKK